MIAADLVARLRCSSISGSAICRSSRRTPTLSPGELQRLRLATQVRSNLFGVVYVLDEPSAGLHPADTEALLDALDRLKAAGNSLFVVEHDMDVVRHADWIVDVGPGAGEHGGEVLYSGPATGLADVDESVTARYLFEPSAAPRSRAPRAAGWLRLRGVTRNNLRRRSTSDFPLGVLTAVTGVSGSGKSTLVSQVLVERRRSTGSDATSRPTDEDEADSGIERPRSDASGGVTRRDRGDQPAGQRGPEADRPHAALEPGHLHRAVRPRAQAIRRDRRRRAPAATTAGRFSFNVAKGRCETCEGEGFVDGRTAVPAERLRAVPDVPRRALQPRDAGDRVSRQDDRRRAAHDRR